MSSRKVQSVAVVGAGISGVVAAVHLLKDGLRVTVFERSSGPGGIWRYDERSAREPPYPSHNPSTGDYIPRNVDKTSDSAEDEGYSSDVEITHAPPGPCYVGLMNNISTPMMQTSLRPWPEATEDFVNHQLLEDYIVALSRSSGLDAVTQYNTRVENVKKSGAAWTVRTSRLTKASAAGRRHILSEYWEFDAVVVASGHYNAPRIPDIEGLQQWKEQWPNRVQHSKGYRKPDMCKDKKILLIGAGVSSSDIARELGLVAAAIYQSSRGGELDLPSSHLPANAVRIGGIAKFELSASASTPGNKLTPDEPLPGMVVLADGQKVCNVHHVILCTGYMASYPFLNQYHSDSLLLEQATPEILVTGEGSQVHNLHKDIFYIPDPTLAFIGTPYHAATFSLFEFQAMALARVFAGTCQLPNEHAMRAEYEEKKERKGLGRDFHSLRRRGEEEAYVVELVEWVNRDAVVHGVEAIRGHTEEWCVANRAREEQMRRLRQIKDKRTEAKRESVDVTLPLGLC